MKHSVELEAFLEGMAVSAAAEANIFDPDYMILGGGVLNMKGFPRDGLHAKILSHVRRPYPAENLRIIYADDELEKGAQGAVYYALEMMKNSVC